MFEINKHEKFESKFLKSKKKKKTLISLISFRCKSFLTQIEFDFDTRKW